MNKEVEKEKNINETPIDETIDETVDTNEEAEAEEPTADELLAEANDKYLRLLAEYDNFKRRTQKEKQQIYTNAAADVVKAVLPFIDNLARATATEAESEDAKNLLEGIKLVERQFLETLKNIGVEEIKAVGEKFDPNFHNAVMHVDDEAIDGEEIVVLRLEESL